MICYIILTFSANGKIYNVISPSEMYHDIYQKENDSDFFRQLIKENGRPILHATILNINFIYAF